MQLLLDPGSFYWPLVFLHLLAFAYWLGGDIGVYVTGGYVARADLPLAERLRFLEALLKIDVLPRTGIVLLPVIGLQLAAMRGAIALPLWGQWLVWVCGVLWLLLVWSVFRERGTSRGETLQRLDISLRYVVIAVLGGVAVSASCGLGRVLLPKN